MSSQKRVSWALAWLALGLFTSTAAAQIPQQARAPIPTIWTASNESWNNHEITIQPEVVVSVTVQIPTSSNLLKITFSGGDLTFQADGNLNPFAVVGIEVDGVRTAEALDFTSTPSFRHRYVSISTILGNVAAGAHTISVVMYKTASDGHLPYTTTTGNTPNTYKGCLVVENWPK